MPYIKYSEEQFLAYQDHCAEFFDGGLTLRQVIRYMKQLKIDDHRIVVELHNAVLAAVWEESKSSKRSSARYRPLG